MEPEKFECTSRREDAFTSTIKVPVWIVKCVSFILMLLIFGAVTTVLVIMYSLFSLSNNQESIKKTVKEAAEYVIKSRENKKRQSREVLNDEKDKGADNGR